MGSPDIPYNLNISVRSCCTRLISLSPTLGLWGPKGTETLCNPHGMLPHKTRYGKDQFWKGHASPGVQEGKSHTLGEKRVAKFTKENHRITEVGRGFWRFPVQPLLYSKQGRLEQVTQDLDELSFHCLQGQRSRGTLSPGFTSRISLAATCAHCLLSFSACLSQEALSSLQPPIR